MQWCSKNDGTVFEFQNDLELITHALYHAVVITQHILKALGYVIQMAMPSGAVITLFDSAVADFTVYATKFWALRITVAGFANIDIPLPKTPLKEFKDAILAVIDVPVIGSENWNFRDENGVIKKGTDFTPQRQYFVLKDGLVDVKPFMVALVVLYLLEKVGLFATASEFIKYYLGLRRNMHITSDLDDILGDTGETQEQVDLVLGLIRDNKQKLQNIENRLGVRLLLR